MIGVVLHEQISSIGPKIINREKFMRCTRSRLTIIRKLFLWPIRFHEFKTARQVKNCPALIFEGKYGGLLSAKSANFQLEKLFSRGGN
jgi:hypothetical protein